MNDDAGSIWPLIIGIGVCAAVVAWQVAKRKGLNHRSWAATCFFFAPALFALAFTRAQHRSGETEEFRSRWASLSAYDPDIKSALARMAALGPHAVEQFRMSYADVQTKEAIPLIVADIEERWAAGDRFDGVHQRTERLGALHQRGLISDKEHADQTQRLSKPPKGRWSGWWWKAPVGLFGLWLVLSLVAPRGSSGFPTCDASAARNLVRNAIESADDNRLVNRKLLSLDEARELNFDPKTRDRMCAGLAVLNSGERRIVWRMYARGDNVFVNVSGF